jgi:Mg2+-importing ATPase
MLIMGPISSIFDFITYGVLLLLSASPELFRTVWFLESLATQTLVIHVIRTSKIPFVQSMPSRFLIMTSILIVLIGFAMPFSPLRAVFAFVHPPFYYFAIVLAIVSAYLFMVNLVKGWFVRKYGHE